MKNEMVPGEMMLRNPLCVRWTDADYKLVVDTAWERRLRVSELVRQLVLEGLREADGGNAAKAAAEASGGGTSGEPNA